VSRIVPWLHPALGLAAVVLAARTASLGLTVRRGGHAAAGARQRHRALGPWTLRFMLANWALGVVTVWRFRDDLDVLASRHASIGAVIVLLLVGSAVTAKRLDGDARLRRIHPWFGVGAILAAAVQTFLGLQLVRW
jgi:hypothetical protein